MTSKVLNNFLSVKVGKNFRREETERERERERERRIIKVNDINETWLRLFYPALPC